MSALQLPNPRKKKSRRKRSLAHAEFHIYNEGNPPNSAKGKWVGKYSTQVQAVYNAKRLAKNSNNYFGIYATSAKGVRSFIKQIAPNPVAHFPQTSRGRPRKVGRPRKMMHAGESVFRSKAGIALFHPDIFEQKTRRRTTSRGRPVKYDYWILDAFINDILAYTYIGAGARRSAVVEAQSMLNTPMPGGIINKVQLSGPYPKEDGKPDASWPRL
jgi:hypothetical protein